VIRELGGRVEEEGERGGGGWGGESADYIRPTGIRTALSTSARIGHVVRRSAAGSSPDKFRLLIVTHPAYRLSSIFGRDAQRNRKY